MLLFLLICTLQSLTQRILTRKASLPAALLVDIRSAEPFPTVTESVFAEQRACAVYTRTGGATPQGRHTAEHPRQPPDVKKTQLSMMKYHSEEGIWNDKKPIISSELLKGSEKNQKLWIIMISCTLHPTTPEQTH